jgi:hypothetical protein
VEKDSLVQTQNVSKERRRQFFEVENAESSSALLTFLQVTKELQKHAIQHMDAASLNSTAGASSLTTPPSLQKNHWTQCPQSLLNVLQTSPHATEIEEYMNNIHSNYEKQLQSIRNNKKSYHSHLEELLRKYLTNVMHALLNWRKKIMTYKNCFLSM